MYVANTGSNTVSVINTATGQTDRHQLEHLLDGHHGRFLAQRAGTQRRRQTAVCGQHRQRHGVGDRHRHLPTHRRQPQQSFRWTSAVGSSPNALALGPTPAVCGQPRQQHGVGDRHRHQQADRHQPQCPLGCKAISVGSSPSALALSRHGRLYVANRGSNTVSVIDTTTNKVIDTNPNLSGVRSITVGSSPSALALEPTAGCMSPTPAAARCR